MSKPSYLNFDSEKYGKQILIITSNLIYISKRERSILRYRSSWKFKTPDIAKASSENL